jgi:DNA-binding CsgD family transcriptional regulator
MMWPVMQYLSIRARQADALFASELQCCDEPSAGQVWQAIAAAIQAFGDSGCAGRVAQEFGDHPETAVTRMRWARAVASEAFPDQGPEPGSRTDVNALPPERPKLCGGQAYEPTVVTALLLGAIAREALGSPYAARQALEHALSLAEPERVPSLVSIPPAHGPQDPRESLTRGETRVLRYLPTHLSAREIAAELCLSMNTVKTHQRHVYEKLGAHSRAQAVERARALGLLTPPSTGAVDRREPAVRRTKRK